ncbi:MAG: hypothetical protein KC503_08270 [Myxococcales bacterium]|nr:hypothetical protein [Myxococcales bacterium]
MRLARWMLVVLCVFAAPWLLACGDDSGALPVSDAEFKAACENGVTLCQGDAQHGQTFGAQDCSDSAIAQAYAGCNAGCRANSKSIIDCQRAASDCDGFASCVSGP